ncbi:MULTISPECIES: ATP-dependent helicase [Coprobacillaceae]|uniref:ATP-dependent helicase n=1 Tax=Coprobacillaceae TaxID=2810280 RepID=UPI000E4C26DC|nr:MULTISPECIES: ATP-dependent helicase [Coprobacillaceae]RHM63161.1 ATP-dependent helicase [Coprobacillus sp. AF33-1AC]RHS93192.1 ATP-dependent helicase [Erysipelatoclostridium sp. AM42-17]
MSKLVTIDSKGRIFYDGMLSSKEKASVDDILNALKKEIPEIETDIEERFGKGVMSKYNLGLILGEFLEKYDIPVYERRRFWDEIKILASNIDRKRDEGKNSSRRSFYEQCFVLSTIDVDVVEKLSWRQWQSLLDRTIIDNDPRILDWIGIQNEKIKEDEWREFLKALNEYLKNKDTQVFNNEELFDIYSSILNMNKYWLKEFKKFCEEHPKSAKIKNKTTWSKKYIKACFKLKRKMKSRIITDEICSISFKELMS